MKLCFLCGAWFHSDQIQRIEIDMKRQFICGKCAKQALLIAGQVKVPGWIAAVWQPRNLSHIASSGHDLSLSNEEIAELADSGRDTCFHHLHGVYTEWWDEFGIPEWLKSYEIIQEGEVKKSP